MRYQAVQANKWITPCGHLPPIATEHREATVYCFPQHEIYQEKGLVRQTRSGPNWQGDAPMTLTTCKHALRSYASVKEGVWLAGFTGINTFGDGRNHLIWLGRITHCIENAMEYYKHILDHYGAAAVRSKSAVSNPLGDLYEPAFCLGYDDPYDPRSYIEPVGHVRYEENDSHGYPKWLKDVNYKYRGKARPKLVVLGESYIWNKAPLGLPEPMGRATHKTTINQLLERLI